MRRRRAEEIQSLSDATTLHEILDRGSRLLRAWSEADATAVFLQRTRDSQPAEVWNWAKPTSITGAEIDRLMRLAIERREFEREMPGSRYVRAACATSEDRSVCVALEFWHTADQARRESPVLLIATLIAEKLGQAIFREDYARIDSVRQQELLVDAELERVLDDVVDDLSFEYGAIWLDDKKRNEIRIARFRNLPAERETISRFSLKDDANITSVYRSGAAQQSNLNREWDAVLVPIRSGQTIIGVLEAGGAQSVGEEVRTTAERIQQLEEIGRRGTRIGEYRPSESALDVAAEIVRSDFGADSVIISGWQGDYCVLDGCARVRSESDYRDVLDAEKNRLPEAREFISIRRQKRSQHVYPPAGQIDMLANSIQNWRMDSTLQDGSGCTTLPFELDDSITILITVFWAEYPAKARIHHLNLLVARIRMLVAGEILRARIRISSERAYHLVALQSVAFKALEQASAEPILGEIVRRASRLLRADLICIYEYFGSENFGRLSAQHGNFLRPKELERDCMPMDIVETHLARASSRFEEKVDELADLRQRRRDGDRERFVVREGIRSCAMLKLIGPNQREMVGVMFLNYRSPRRFPREYQREAEALGLAAGTAISLQRFHDANERRLTRLSGEEGALDRLNAFIVEQINQHDDAGVRLVCMEALSLLVTFLGASVGNVVRHDAAARTLDFLACHGFAAPANSQPAEKGVAGRAIANRTYYLVSDTRDDPSYVSVDNYPFEMRSELIVPIIHGGGRLWGLINLEHRSRGHFSVEDVRLVELFARQLGFAALLFEELANHITQRITFGTIATRIQDPEQSLFRKLRLLLTGVTAQEGLGFNRAMILLIDENGRRLRGEVGIGSLTEDAARGIWNALRNPSGTPAFQRLKHLLDITDSDSLKIERGEIPDSEFSQRVKTVAAEIGDISGILKDCLISQVTHTDLVTESRADWLATSMDENHTGVSWQLRAVPLVPGGKFVGVLVVDNRFQPERENIPPAAETLRTLEAYADMAGMVVENTRLRERIRAETYLKVDHELKNPISLALRFVQNAVNGDHSGLKIAGAQVQKAQWVANNIKLFSDLSMGHAFPGVPQTMTVKELLDRFDLLLNTWRLLFPERQISYTKQIDLETAFTLVGDWNLLEQALYALMNNAGMHSLGPVELDLCVTQRHLRFSLRNSTSMGDAEFDKFQQWHGRGANSHGSGLGYNIAKEAVQMLNGKLIPTYAGGVFEVVADVPLEECA